MPSLVAPAMSVGHLAESDQPTLPVGDDVLLRPWLLTDAAAVREAFQDPAIQRWHVRRADSLDEAREWIEGWRSGWREETGAHWAVVDAESDTLLGRVALKSLVLTDGKAELAYWMVPSARGGGLCPRAVMVLTRWALGKGGFHRIELEHSTANRPSCRVAIKAGFEEEGIRRRAWLHADGWHDVHLHARIRQDS
ncbi:GNAT family N-acetyltransferase [Streptomyces sp. NBC_01142]|uniref:GNAT family N-acetyltransferase n=1 Tax=Streptomyces sp. NBC_01142 TaxID=2975865 RepID=UPI0022549497|nr:GNAT family N-acetyltransferase [Streptomyces sp. NBC_01142]MCX4821020.1 GNAT family N-acetyltransferase [Streptomyces sp. NBC_01142]